MARRPDGKIEQLLAQPGMAGATRVELDLLGRLVEEATLPAGSVLCLEGEVGQEGFWIIDGEVRVSVGTDEVTRLGPGDFVGEMALLARGIRTATAITTTPTRLFAFDVRRFSALFDSPAVAELLAKQLASRLRRATASQHAAASGEPA
jgi:voltage-gated potassium channel